MRSPTGTLYAVTRENVISRRIIYLKPSGTEYLMKKVKSIFDNPINRLELIGDGFHMGVCAAFIENTDDYGTWTCQLDLVNGIKVEKEISVHARGNVFFP